MQCPRCGRPAEACTDCGGIHRDGCARDFSQVVEFLKKMPGFSIGMVAFLAGPPPPRPADLIRDLGGGSIGKAFSKLMEGG